MTTDEALPELRRRLAEAGFDDARPDLGLLWQVFRPWAALPVEGMDPEIDADMLLFECSLSLRAADEHSPLDPSFTVGLTRQFSFEDEDGEYAGMAQLNVALIYAVHDDFRAITTMSSWSDEFGTADLFWGGGAQFADDWATRVEATRSFQTALGHRPRAASLVYGPV